MKDMVLDLIDSYEHRVVTVESLINSAYETAVDSDEGISQAYKTEQKLRDDLRETLVRNCSLRRKDFDTFTAMVFSRIDAKKTEIENQRKQIRQILKIYLERQKGLIVSLKEQLAKFNQQGANRTSLEAILVEMKTSQREDGEQTFSLLRDIQFRLKIFRQELADLNISLQRILERGELLKVEDLRQLKASLAQERRKSERNDRKEDVERLLVRFNRKRQETVHYYTQQNAVF